MCYQFQILVAAIHVNMVPAIISMAILLITALAGMSTWVVIVILVNSYCMTTLL